MLSGVNWLADYVRLKDCHVSKLFLKRVAHRKLNECLQ